MVTTSGRDLNVLSKRIVLVGLAVFAFGCFIFWKSIIMSSENVFYGMIENSLRVRSATKRIVQDSDTQSLDQIIYFQTGDNNIASAQTTLSQESESGTKVITESLGTPYEDFVRYVAIDTKQKSASGKALDFSSVVGVWGKSENLDQNVTDTPGELFSQVVLGVVPMGYIEEVKRAEVLKKVRELQVYETDFGQVNSNKIDGRPSYNYSITVQPMKYVEMLKIFAEAIGLEQLRQVDPREFANSPPLNFEFLIDSWSRQLLEVRFTDGGRTEFFSGYGAKANLSVPKESIPIQELQIKLQAAGEA